MVTGTSYCCYIKACMNMLTALLVHLHAPMICNSVLPKKSLDGWHMDWGSTENIPAFHILRLCVSCSLSKVCFFKSSFRLLLAVRKKKNQL